MDSPELREFCQRQQEYVAAQAAHRAACDEETFKVVQWHERLYENAWHQLTRAEQDWVRERQG